MTCRPHEAGLCLNGSYSYCWRRPSPVPPPLFGGIGIRSGDRTSASRAVSVDGGCWILPGSRVTGGNMRPRWRRQAAPGGHGPLPSAQDGELPRLRVAQASGDIRAREGDLPPRCAHLHRNGLVGAVQHHQLALIAVQKRWAGGVARATGCPGLRRPPCGGASA
jgi:hypothetical protein